ncbi:MBOAT family O-acyltransferase [Rhodopirellula europaea]|uniref:Membrane bound O-acyl transferase, MBOAT family protein n=1 Tax=Rhodopirellula europaea SH398 TaxID=1263868 RepID=M5SF16_9BACT|nr:MBOAT family protein [Rhodopirellula europaea]EMI24759.1 membrane bound O-acyl transferase, MBOAT family protein [Rhodopirellula europaea SH398]
MLFNSYEFLFAFLPITLIGYRLLVGHQVAIAKAWLVICSLFFYAWWNPPFVGLLLGSICANFCFAKQIYDNSGRRQKSWLGVGVAFNLALIGYFKYAGFLAGNLDTVFGTNIAIGEVFLPLAISFFTFQQITYLVDASKEDGKVYGFLDYALFVTFFPQLIAGPILHHSEILPQFDRPRKSRMSDFCVGVTIFTAGLFKKVVIADTLALRAQVGFSMAAGGDELSTTAAWAAALAYTSQLYFDFSGYSDMAIGAARLFGMKLPINFFSPYRATNIVDFWRRWHITLSRFLRDYLYIPLGGNRKGKFRRHMNLMITMLLGGLWHGAGWTFIVWGGLHGLYLVVNHGWHAVRKTLPEPLQHPSPAMLPIAHAASWLLTFVCVVVGWVFFRSESFGAATGMLACMFHWVPTGGNEITSSRNMVLIGASLIMAVGCPNLYQIMQRYSPAIITGGLHAVQNSVWSFRWRPSPVWGFVSAVLLAISVLHLTEVSEFLYFQF